MTDRVAFITETNHQGKWPKDFPNARTEVAWQIALNADHYNIHRFEKVKGYDHVFIIFPKGQLNLNGVGSKLANIPNPYSQLLASDWLNVVKSNNKKVHFIQEGPHWIFTDLEVRDQINFYNTLFDCDSIFAHNEQDVRYYKGLFPNKPIHVIRTLMIEDLIKNIAPTKENKVIIGGNFARWYGGFESYMIAQRFQLPIWSQTSHATRDGEDQLVNHLPRLQWVDWIKELSTFKVAVHLMPTVAAGTFSLNCAYLGIPCIGNTAVDTQRICHPALSVEVSDLESANEMAQLLRKDEEFYQMCSRYAKVNYNMHYSLDVWKENMRVILNTL